jgi:hypothetical protein
MKLKTIYRRRVVRRVALGLAVCAAFAPTAQGMYLHDGGGNGATAAAVRPDDRAARPSGTVVVETAQRPDDRAVRPAAETSPSSLPAYSIDGPRSGPATSLPVFSIDGPRSAPGVVGPGQIPAADNGLDWRVSVGIGLGALAMLMAAGAALASRRRGTFQGA